MNKEQGEEPGNQQITVPVPLEEYLDLLSAREVLDRPVRTRVQAAKERIEKLTREVEYRLPLLNRLEVRGKKRTEQSCYRLQRDIIKGVRKFTYYHDPDEYFDLVFRSCLGHYIYFYDADVREWIVKKDEESSANNLSRVRSYLLHPIPTTEEAPVLSDYRYQLPLELRPLLPFYVATYFIPKPSLSLPPEIEQTLSGSV